MDKNIRKRMGRIKRHRRIRKNVFGTAEMPRLAVFRSNKYIYAQIINDEDGITIVSASALEKEILKEKKEDTTKKGMSRLVGKLLAKKAMEKGVEKVVFDRGGYIYHGRIKELADGAREGGLKF